ncbi:acyltransferase domain-containing protein [Arthrobacter sp. B2a2-09]|uniref:acyltransferase domain-containing protein n=1 Tax=Arthrobacter sp. B2a2-09 TaxID=2952822 RepID=UPI0022CD2D38|nr:acyltransferase domain-containing protein [Arthrobacter sp. B2a2-09]MCZ9883733.1 acyltransferase domain-containing protein [Arthrobacter sp. B2a2-09]
MTGIEQGELFRLLDIHGEDAFECASLLASPPEDGTQQALAILQARLGAFPSRSASADGCTETDWIEALLRFAPVVHGHHLSLGIPPEASAAILADVGLNLRINRRVHGHFGLDTWAWLTLHMAGNIFRIGRLQFHLVRDAAGSVTASGSWVLGVHIPEDGGLSPALVDSSFSQAREFFDRYFPDKAVSVASCDSWMLDPYLARKLPDSNIAAFARRFSLDRCSEAPSDAVYFTFRHRGMENLDRLPRETSLQRVVLERIDDGGVWQLGHGHLELPPAQANPA